MPHKDPVSGHRKELGSVGSVHGATQLNQRAARARAKANRPEMLMPSTRVKSNERLTATSDLSHRPTQCFRNSTPVTDAD